MMAPYPPQRVSPLRVPAWAQRLRMASWNVDTLTPSRDAWRRRAEGLAAAGVNSVTLFWFGEKEHYRHVIFDSAIYEVTHQQFGFSRVFEALALVCEVCHEVGIRVIDHHGFAFVHYDPSNPYYQVPIEGLRYAESPMHEWLCVDTRTGGPTLGQYKGYVFCPNRPAFQEATSHLAKRLLECGIDGLMLDDISFMPSYHVCGCEVCRAEFAKVGGTLPPADDARFWGNYENPEFREWLRFRLRSTTAFHRKQAEAIAEVRDDILYYACCSTNLLIVAAQNQGWSYDGWIEAANGVHRENCNWRLNPFCWVDTVVEEKISHAIGRATQAPCINLIYPHSYADYFNAWAQTMTLGSNLWGGYQHYNWQDSATAPRIQRHPPGTPEEAIGKSYQWEVDYPEFFPRSHSSYASIAVVFSPATRNVYGGNDDSYYSREFSGWCQMLLRDNRLFNVILEDHLAEQLEGDIELLILPNWACMSDTAAELIRIFTQRGGRVIATAETGYRDQSGAIRSFPALNDLAESVCAWFKTKPGASVYTSTVGSMVDFGRPPFTFFENPDSSIEAAMQDAVGSRLHRAPVKIQGGRGVFINAIATHAGVVVHVLNQSAFQWRGGEMLREGEWNRFSYPPLQQELTIQLTAEEAFDELLRLDLPSAQLSRPQVLGPQVTLPKGENLVYTVLLFRVKQALV